MCRKLEIAVRVWKSCCECFWGDGCNSHTKLVKTPANLDALRKQGLPAPLKINELQIFRSAQKFPRHAKCLRTSKAATWLRLTRVLTAEVGGIFFEKINSKAKTIKTNQDIIS